ncbi:cytochrome P450 3A30-like [Oppia nitens]|uniref:cytochrome P450 3A30-like n=1 Tax=Oppia nitens TaxID=1686743 RepID=UPI0023DA2474|nr:cytochrome P450 3A30-like [Oppia nitens]
MIILITIVCLVAILFYRHLNRNYSYWSDRGLKGPKPIIWFGNTFEELFRRISLIDRERRLKYGPTYGVFEGTDPILVTSDPRLIKNILVKDFNTFRNRLRVLLTPADHPIYRHVIDNTKDDDWLRMRAVVKTLFTDIKLRSMVSKIEANLRNLTKALDGWLGRETDAEAVVDIREMFVNQGIDLIGSAMFSLDQDSFSRQQSAVQTNDFTPLIKRIFFPSKFRILAIFVLPKFLLQFLDICNIMSKQALNDFADLTVRQITKRKQSPDDVYEDFLQSLLNRCRDFQERQQQKQTVQTSSSDEVLQNNKQMLATEEVVANVFSLFQGAFDGHSISMTFITYELAVNPDCQQRVYDEISQCWDQSTGQFDFETLVRLDYLDACISEALRLHSAVIRDGRVATQDYVDQTTGVTIKKDQVVIFSRSALHRCPDYYQEPEKFRPDRFLSANKSNLVAYTFLPFSLGGRMCPGNKFALNSIKLTMAHLLIRYRFKQCDQTVLKTEPLVEHYTYCPEKLFLKVEKRVTN